MRRPTDRERIERFLAEFGSRVQGPGSLYLVGGATALWYGWRDTTVDIDLKLDPEPAGGFALLARLKEELEVNVELASPDQFLPELEDWKEHSPYVGHWGKIGVFHYDLRAQLLAKLARGHDRDLRDAAAMVENGLVGRSEIEAALESVTARLIRFPGLDAPSFLRRVRRFLAEDQGKPGHESPCGPPRG